MSTEILAMSYKLQTMTQWYLGLYTAFDLVCLALLFIALFRIRHGTVKVPFSDHLTRLILSAVMIIVENDIWNWISIGHISVNITISWIINITYFMAMQLMYYNLFLYFYMSVVNKPINGVRAFYISIPCIIMIILNLTDFKHQWFFTITNDIEYVRGPFYVFEYLVSYIYLLIPYIHVVKQFIQSKLDGMPIKKVQRNVHTMPATIGTMALIGMWVNTIPLISIATSLTILFLYVDLLEDFVTIDPISTLNTKAKFMTELKNRMAIQDMNNRDDLYVMMIDILHLRLINDKYGHTEGDNLIRRVSQIIQRQTALSSKLNLYAARYSGNMFAVILNCSDEQDMINLCTNLQVKVTKSDIINKVDYHTEIMYGFSKYNHDDNITKLIENTLDNLAINKLKYEQIKNINNIDKEEET